MTPLVTAIVTSYNHAEYLDQRMESLLNQTWDNLEIIVVDDCSTDGSREVLEKYRKNKKVKLLFLERNGGYANACNLGVKESEGKYIMFAECDDYNGPQHIETLVQILEKNENVGVVYSRSNIIDEAGNVLGNDFDVREKSFRERCRYDTLIPNELIRKYLLFSCVIPNMSAALVRKKSIMAIDGFSHKYLVCADWDFWCRMTEDNDFYYISNPLNYFRTHSNTVRRNAHIRLQMTEHHDILYKMFSKSNLTFREGMRFKMNLGFIWANFIILNPSDWFMSLPFVWRNSLRYDKFGGLYLILGLFAKLIRTVQRFLRIR